MTERKRHKNYQWSLPDFDEQYHPHGDYPTEWAKISVLQDIRDNLVLILQEMTREEPKAPWWKLW